MAFAANHAFATPTPMAGRKKQRYRRKDRRQHRRDRRVREDLIELPDAKASLRLVAQGVGSPPATAFAASMLWLLGKTPARRESNGVRAGKSTGAVGKPSCGERDGLYYRICEVN